MFPDRELPVCWLDPPSPAASSSPGKLPYCYSNTASPFLLSFTVFFQLHTARSLLQKLGSNNTVIRSVFSPYLFLISMKNVPVAASKCNQHW